MRQVKPLLYVELIMVPINQGMSDVIHTTKEINKAMAGGTAAVVNGCVTFELRLE